MATTKNNVIVKGASGKFGKQIVFSQRAGKTIMSKPPVRTAPPTTKQKEQQAKFARAPLTKSRLHRRSKKTSRRLCLQYGYDRLPTPTCHHRGRPLRIHRNRYKPKNHHPSRRRLQSHRRQSPNRRRRRVSSRTRQRNSHRR